MQIDIQSASSTDTDHLQTPKPIQLKGFEKNAQRYADYLVDESKLRGGTADHLLFPECEEQLQAILINAWKSGNKLTVSSGRTGLVGGAVPFGGSVLSMEKMDRILDSKWDEDNQKWLLTVQPGVSLDRLRRFLDSGGQSESTEKPVSETMDKFLAESRNWFYPPDPTEKLAHIGGTVSTDASGSRSYAFGSTRHHIESIRLVLTNGAVLAVNRGEIDIRDHDVLHIYGPAGLLTIPIHTHARPIIKNTAGYYLDHSVDLLDLLIGSEGTLGVISEITLSLRKKPESILGLVICFGDEQSCFDCVANARSTKSSVSPVSIEFLDTNAIDLLKQHGKWNAVLAEEARAVIYLEQPYQEADFEQIMADYEELLGQNGVDIDRTWAGFEPKVLNEMESFRHALPEIVNTVVAQNQTTCPELHKISTDFVIPDENFARMYRLYRETLNQENIPHVIFGHIGENHLHVNMLPIDMDAFEKAKLIYVELAQNAIQLGGSISGEHGIGKIKRHLMKLMFSSEELQNFKTIKEGFDPKGLLNPGNLF